MENPGKILQRARFGRHLRSMPSLPKTQEERAETTEPMHHSSHASYTALMRSHDRMRTRHINGQGGGNGA